MEPDQSRGCQIPAAWRVASPRAIPWAHRNRIPSSRGTDSSWRIRKSDPLGAYLYTSAGGDWTTPIRAARFGCETAESVCSIWRSGLSHVDPSRCDVLDDDRDNLPDDAAVLSSVRVGAVTTVVGGNVGEVGEGAAEVGAEGVRAAAAAEVGAELPSLARLLWESCLGFVAMASSGRCERGVTRSMRTSIECEAARVEKTLIEAAVSPYLPR